MLRVARAKDQTTFPSKMVELRFAKKGLVLWQVMRAPSQPIAQAVSVPMECVAHLHAELGLTTAVRASDPKRVLRTECVVGLLREPYADRPQALATLLRCAVVTLRRAQEMC